VWHVSGERTGIQGLGGQSGRKGTTWEDLGIGGKIPCNEYAFCVAHVNNVLFRNATGLPSRLKQEQSDFVTERSYKQEIVMKKKISSH
jgi:hypothetical protein